MFLGISFFDLRYLVNMVLDHNKKKDDIVAVQNKTAPMFIENFDVKSVET